MKIALLHYSAPPVVGGVESVLGHHARLMAAGGHEVRIVAGRGGDSGPHIRFAALPLADSRHPDVLASKGQLDLGRLPADFATLVGRIEAGLRAALAGVDVLIAHNVCSLHKNLALTAALFNLHQSGASAAVGRAFRLILWHHDLAWTTPRYRAELHAGYPWDLLRQDWPGARHVVVSEQRRGELAALLTLHPEQIAVVPSGVEAAAFLGLHERAAAIVSRLGLWEAAPLLLLPVRITTRKNIELALRALAALRRRASGPEYPYRRAALVVTGPPGPHNPANAEYFARLKALRAELGLEGAAHFLAELTDEYLPDEVIADLYRVADALIMPSREEGFGIPLLEAGLARLPVFCADIPPLLALGGSQATYFSPDADPARVAALIAGRLGEDRQYALAARVRAEYLWERVYANQVAPLLEP